jgi:pimeloyl-ACP methyl ester carboxylesterase
MKFKSYLVFVEFLTLIPVASLHAQGKVIRDSFFSPAMNQTRSVNAYVPPGYNANDNTIRYPVVYFLHGAGLNHGSYPEITDAAEQLISSQLIDPVIIVKPDASGGPFDQGPYTNSPLYGNLEDYLVSDLIAFIDTKYHTQATRERRVIMGHSAGGYGAMRFALRHPDLYRAVASHSAVLDLATEANDLLPCALAENGGPGPFTDPFKGDCIEGMFSRASGFSPNLNNPPFFVDLPIDNSGNLIDSTWAKWLEHNPRGWPRITSPVQGRRLRFISIVADKTICSLKQWHLMIPCGNWDWRMSFNPMLATTPTGCASASVLPWPTSIPSGMRESLVAALSMRFHVMCRRA